MRVGAATTSQDSRKEASDRSGLVRTLQINQSDSDSEDARGQIEQHDKIVRKGVTSTPKKSKYITSSKFTQTTWRHGPAPRHGFRKSSQPVVKVEDSWSPTNPLNKGSSDPFAATVVPVDIVINGLVAFDRYYMGPFLASMEKGSDVSVSYLNKMYQSPAVALHDERTAHANLARLAILKAAVTGDPDTHTVAVQLISKAYSDVREKLRLPCVDQDLAVRVLHLLAFDVFARKYQAAAMHAHILQNIFLQLRRSGFLTDHVLLKSAFFVDMMRCLLSWTMPIVIMEDITPLDIRAVLPAMINYFERRGLLSREPPAHFSGAGIPQGEIMNEVLQTLLLFRLGRVINEIREGRGPFVESTVGVWAIEWAINFQRTLQIHLRAKTQCANWNADDSSRKRTAAVSLAMLYWEHSAGNFDFIRADRAAWRLLGPAWSPTKRMLAELDTCIRAIDWQNDGDAVPELRLWLLYVCTLAEQVTVHIAQSQNGWLGKYNQAFVSHAEALTLSTWPDVVVVLRGYAYHTDVSSLSEPWFYACLRTRQMSVEEVHLHLGNAAARPR